MAYIQGALKSLGGTTDFCYMNFPSGWGTIHTSVTVTSACKLHYVVIGHSGSWSSWSGYRCSIFRDDGANWKHVGALTMMHTIPTANHDTSMANIVFKSSAGIDCQPGDIIGFSFYLQSKLWYSGGSSLSHTGPVTRWIEARVITDTAKATWTAGTAPVASGAWNIALFGIEAGSSNELREVGYPIDITHTSIDPYSENRTSIASGASLVLPAVGDAKYIDTALFVAYGAKLRYGTIRASIIRDDGTNYNIVGASPLYDHSFQGSYCNETYACQFAAPGLSVLPGDMVSIFGGKSSTLMYNAAQEFRADKAGDVTANSAKATWSARANNAQPQIVIIGEYIAPSGSSAGTRMMMG